LGLAQFFYTNQLDWYDSINFVPKTNEQYFAPPSNGEGAISALGGGKDSIVAAEILKEAKVDTDLWAVNQAERFENLANKMNLKILSVTRKIDPLLLELNGKDAYNGHVPITAINSFIGVVLAILTGKKSVIWAIESSADEINTSWKGLQVNHQYSKSYEFEKEMANYIKKNIAKDLEHYSILRPLTELRISEIFCKNYIDKYNGLFSSCNANFSLNNNDKLNWCGKCPKCAFVFIVFSPFIKKSNLLGLFNGRNIFADEDMKPIIEELLGISGHKPLECVGEIAETRLAINMAKDTGEYPELNQFDFPTVKYDYKKWSSNSIPKELLENIKSNISKI
jgi:7-cyano-7-deazaguanine synthase in queuosine biosynthesis